MLRAPYIAVRPCKPAASRSLSFDTSMLADGPHSARVLVADATVSNIAAFGPFAITTANAPTELRGGRARATCRRGSIASGPRSPTAASSTSLGQPHRRARRSRVFSQIFERRRGGAARATPIVAGRDRASSPIKGAGRPVAQACASPIQRRRPALTAARKALNVAVQGPQHPESDAAHIRSGQRVRFSGKLRGGYVPKRGKLIELQAFERRRWRSITDAADELEGRVLVPLSVLVPRARRDVPRPRPRPHRRLPTRSRSGPLSRVRVRVR